MVGEPSLYECELTHARSAPLRHAFRYRTYLWLVDLDAPPRLPWYVRPWAGLHARDHVGDPGGTIRSSVDSYAAEHGVDLRGGRILMLTQARVFGYVFNPITVYWCRDAADAPACVVVEVHNTYGGRHRYLVRPDERHRAVTDKQFYVSPFFPVDGEYRMRLPEPGARLALTIALHRDGGTPFAAGVHGVRRPLTPRTLLRAAWHHPLSTVMVSLRIRRHGVHLYLRGLPVQPRPPAAPERESAGARACRAPIDPPTRGEAP